MAKNKEIKTNAMRILDRLKIEYEVVSCECDEFTGGSKIADMEGIPHELSYKTIVCRGKSGEHYVFVIPVDDEIDLKSAASAVGEKSVALISVKELTPLTGYVRGGCSPVGMKKKFPTVIHDDAVNREYIYVSAGKIGCSVKIRPDDLIKAVEGKCAAII
ncbi:MAG: Cys-tRNA(Pro) deacylase [Lachnospiraceae bacterium]|jgi:Cys-tRNA(Pro)/Cys-tRNA(Cys) deacylase